MKILHLLKHSQRGNGHVHVAVDLACAQADAGHDVVFASARGSFDDLLRDHGVRVIDLPEPVDRISALKHLLALWRLAKSERPLVAHAHMMSSAVLAWPVTRLVRTRLVTTVHNSFDKHSSLMRVGDVIVAVSEAERDNLLTRGFPARKLVTVLNGVLGSARRSLPHDDIGQLARPCAMTLCGLHARKGLRDSIAAFAEIATDFPDWHLNIIGWGPERSSLEEWAQQLGVGSAVHFMGSTSTPWSYLEEADIFISSALEEPFSLSTAEARVAGCAIVATAVGGVPEVIEHGRAGQLVPSADPSRLAAALHSMMADPQYLAEWQRRSRTGIAWLAISRMAEQYEEIYQGHVSGPSAPNRRGGASTRS